MSPPTPNPPATRRGPGGESRVCPGERSGRIVDKREAEGDVSVSVKTDRKERIWTHKSPGLTCKHSLVGGVGGGRRKGDKVPEIMTATAFHHSLKACWRRFSSRKSHRSNQEAEGQDIHLLICKFIPPTKRNTVKKKKSRPVCARTHAVFYQPRVQPAVERARVCGGTGREHGTGRWKPPHLAEASPDRYESRQ